MSKNSPFFPRSDRLLLIFVVALSLFIRIYGFWQKKYNLNEMNNLPTDFRMFLDPTSYSYWKDPFFRLTVLAFIKLFGEAPYIVRTPSVIFSILVVLVSYKIFTAQRSVFYMLCFSFILIYMGQQAHPLIFSFFFFLLSYLALDKGKILYAALSSFVGVLSYQIYITFFFFLVFYFLLKSKRPLLLVLLTSFIAFGLLHLYSHHTIYLRRFEWLSEIFKPNVKMSFSILSLIRFISSDIFDATFVLFLAMSIIGLFKVIRKDPFFVACMLFPSLLNYFLAIWYMNYISPRYFIPASILFLICLSEGFKILSNRLRVPEGIFVLLFIASNMLTYFKYIKSPTFFDFPFSPVFEKLKDKDKVYVVPRYTPGRGAYSEILYFTTFISYELRHREVEFIIDGEVDVFREMLKGVYFSDKHKTIALDDVCFPQDIYVIVYSIDYPQIGGLIEWWQVDLERLRDNKRLIEGLISYGIDEFDISIGFLGFRHTFKDGEELNRLTRLILRLTNSPIYRRN